jgi:hypothetical protein
MGHPGFVEGLDKSIDGAPVLFPGVLTKRREGFSSGNWFEGSQVSNARPGAPFDFTLRFQALISGFDIIEGLRRRGR